MGLIKAAVSAIGSTLGDQFLTVIKCDDMGNDILMKKITDSNGALAKGSRIICAPGQVAVIYDSGKILDATAEPGTYQFDQSTTPSFFAGQFGEVFKENPSHTVKEEGYKLDKKSKVKCYSSIDFVEKTKHTGVFDMELYTLATMFPNIKSVKIVSDNLNYKEYKDVDIKESWKSANEILFNLIRR